MSATTKTRPALFNGPMVRALLDDSKTQTRRIAKNCKHPDFGNLYTPGALATEPQHVIDRACPYGQPGDKLWVRETFQPLFADGREHGLNAPNWDTGEGYAVSYPATDGVQEFMDADDNLKTTCKPSIHMPRWASRITLEIVSVRVERLQAISREDAIAEGMADLSTPDATLFGIPGVATAQHPVRAYWLLWESINGAGSWDANPYVWVIKFKRVAS